MATIFVLQHEYESLAGPETKFIGVYSSRAAALAAAERLVVAPGFRDYPDGFSVDEYEIDRDHWTEGFF